MNKNDGTTNRYVPIGICSVIVEISIARKRPIGLHSDQNRLEYDMKNELIKYWNEVAFKRSVGRIIWLAFVAGINLICGHRIHTTEISSPIHLPLMLCSLTFGFVHIL